MGREEARFGGWVYFVGDNWENEVDEKIGARG